MANADDMLHDIRRARAEEDERRARQYINRFAAHGIRVEAGPHYGATSITVRFDDVERMLALLGRTPGDNRDTFDALVTKPSKRSDFPFGHAQGPNVPDDE